MPTLQWVIFDLGRVLIRIADGWASAGREAGFELTPAQVRAMQRHAATLSALNHEHECGRLACEEFAQRVAQLTGLEPEQVLAGLDAWIIEPYASTPTLLAELRAAGMKTACLSNTNAWHWRRMSDPDHAKYVGIREMDFAFASHELGLRKPDPQVYRRVQAQLGASAASIVFFDDLPQNVAAARAQGWQSVLIDRDQDPGPQLYGHLRRLGVLDGVGGA